MIDSELFDLQIIGIGRHSFIKHNKNYMYFKKKLSVRKYESYWTFCFWANTYYQFLTETVHSFLNELPNILHIITKSNIDN